MNFEDIKSKMNSQNMESQVVPKQIKDLKASILPIHKIRRNLRNEIVLQTVIIIIFFFFPSFVEINPIAKGMYFILIFITALITFIYLMKMNNFLRQSSKLSINTREVILNIIHELKLTLEVYKNGIISGSLLLLMAVIIFNSGRGFIDESYFLDLISLNIPSKTLILYIIGYLITALGIYVLTIWWTNRFYGKYLKDLEDVLEGMSSEEIS